MVVRVQRYPLVTSPFEGIFNFGREIDQLLEDFPRTGISHRHYPALDVAEHENESVIVAELPGVRKEDVKISVHDGMLTISGERKSTSESTTWVRSEIRTGEFTRTIQLPHKVDADAVTAELNNGVLRITLPRAAEARPREIVVK